MGIIEGSGNENACLCDAYVDTAGFLQPDLTQDVLYFNCPFPVENYSINNVKNDQTNARHSTYPTAKNALSLTVEAKMNRHIATNRTQHRNIIRDILAKWSVTFPYFLMWDNKNSLNEQYWNSKRPGDAYPKLKKFIHCRITNVQMRMDGEQLIATLSLERGFDD